MRFFLPAIVLLSTCAPAFAQTSIALPSRGYYRAGAYMPLQVTAGACQKLTIGGDGVLPIEIEAKGSAIDAVFPLLIVGSPRELTVTTDNAPPQKIPLQLQLVGENERVPGMGGDERIVVPKSALLADAAYRAASGWRPGIPGPILNLALLGGLLVVILLLGATLLRRRWALVAVAIVAIASIAAIAAVMANQPILRSVYGNILIVDGPRVQYDSWTFYAAPRATEVKVEWSRDTWPILKSPEQIQRQKLVLHCRPNGEGRELTARLEANELLATLSRAVYEEKLQVTTDQSTDSPLHPLMREHYLRPGVQLVGQSTVERGSERAWPAIILKVDAPATKPE